LPVRILVHCSAQGRIRSTDQVLGAITRQDFASSRVGPVLHGLPLGG
jgi:hypothetical protein